MMTLEQAKQILKTYRPPLSPQQLEDYKKALALVTNAALKPPQGG